MLIPYQPFFAALANRCRGGLIKVASGQLGRLVCWALPMAGMICLTARPVAAWDKLWYGIELTIAFFAGVAIPNWGPNRTLATPKDWAMMTLWGLVVMGLPAVIVFAAGFFKLSLFMVLGGLTMAPAYWLGNKIPSKIPQLETGEPMQEVVAGFMWGLFIYLSTIV